MITEARFEASSNLGASPGIAASDWVVLKFGGTSVSSAACWETIAQLVRNRLADGLKPVVVHSALQGVSKTYAGHVTAVKDLQLTIGDHELVVLVGPSGCGKTTTALALMKLLPASLKQSGEILLHPPKSDEPINVHKRTEAGMRMIRWRHISLIFQGAMNSLDPVQRVDDQIAEAIRLHAKGGSSEAVRARIDELLATVGLTSALGHRYPHELSGGQRQRVMIALALACNPSLVIADEPTTALDVVMQAQVLRLLERLREELGLALILISHDLGVLAETCDRIAIMYAGRIVESGPSEELFDSPNDFVRQFLNAEVVGPLAMD